MGAGRTRPHRGRGEDVTIGAHVSTYSKAYATRRGRGNDRAKLRRQIGWLRDMTVDNRLAVVSALSHNGTRVRPSRPFSHAKCQGPAISPSPRMEHGPAARCTHADDWRLNR